MIRAQINLRLLAFTLIFVVLFTYLGFWQLERAEVKKGQLAQQAVLEALPPIRLADLEVEQRQSGRRVVATGTIRSDKVFFLDNIVVQGQVGFEVIHPMRLQSGQSVLINRGFVRAGASRQVLPAVPFLKDSMNALGAVYVSQWLNSDTEMLYTGWPRVVPTQDPEALSRVLGGPLLPWVVRLDSNDPNSLPRHWVTTVMSPEKHTGYAVQWFAMAVVLLALFVYSVFKKRKEEEL